jgi:hypothetical protein
VSGASGGIRERLERRVGDATRPALVRWEGLSAPVQIFTAFPVLVVLIFLFHLAFFNLSVFRSFFYAIFWGIPATLLIAVATRNEAARRARARDEQPPPE